MRAHPGAHVRPAHALQPHRHAQPVHARESAGGSAGGAPVLASGRDKLRAERRDALPSLLHVHAHMPAGQLQQAHTRMPIGLRASQTRLREVHAQVRVRVAPAHELRQLPAEGHARRGLHGPRGRPSAAHQSAQTAHPQPEPEAGDGRAEAHSQPRAQASTGCDKQHEGRGASRRFEPTKSGYAARARQKVGPHLLGGVHDLVSSDLAHCFDRLAPETPRRPPDLDRLHGRVLLGRQLGIPPEESDRRVRSKRARVRRGSARRAPVRARLLL